jgi:hypothetical protein
VHPTARAIIIFDVMGAIKGKFGNKFPLGHFQYRFVADY